MQHSQFTWTTHEQGFFEQLQKWKQQSMASPSLSGFNFESIAMIKNIMEMLLYLDDQAKRQYLCEQATKDLQEILEKHPDVILYNILYLIIKQVSSSCPENQIQPIPEEIKILAGFIVREIDVKKPKKYLANSYYALAKFSLFIEDENTFLEHFNSAMEYGDYIQKEKFRKILFMEKCPNTGLAPISEEKAIQILDILLETQDDSSFQSIFLQLMTFECRPTSKRENDFGPGSELYTQGSYLAEGDQLIPYHGLSRRKMPLLQGKEIHFYDNVEDIEQRNIYIREFTNMNKSLFQSKQIQNEFIKYIQETKDSSSQNIIRRASQAITMLNYSGFEFQNLDLSNVKIPNADLSFSTFKNVDLSSSDCSSCIFDRSILQKVNFAKSNLENCSFGNFQVIENNSKVNASIIASDFSVIASGYEDSTIKLYDFQTKKCIGLLTDHEQSVLSIDISPDNRYLISGSLDQTIKLWNIKDQKCIHTFSGHSDQVNCVKFALNGKFFVSGSYDQTIRAWDLESKECYSTISNLQGKPLSIDINPMNNSQILIGSSEGAVEQWDINNAKQLNYLSWNNRPQSQVQFIWEADIEIPRAISATSDGYLVFRDFTGQSKLKAFQQHQKNIIFTKVSYNKKYIITTSEDCILTLWKAANFQVLMTYSLETSPIVYACLSEDDSIITYCTQDDKIIQIPFEKVKIVQSIPSRNKINAIKLSHKGQFLVTGDERGNIKLYDTNTMNLIQQAIVKYINSPSCFDFSADDKKIAVGLNNLTGANIDGIVEVRCLYTLKVLQQIGKFKNVYTSSVHFSQNSEYLAISIKSSQIGIWDLKKNIQCFKIKLSNLYAIDAQFSPDSKTLAVGGDNLKIWDVKTSQCLKDIFSTSYVKSLKYSSDGRYIGFVSNNNEINTYDIKNDELFSKYTSNDYQDFSSICFSNSDQNLMVISGQFLYVFDVSLKQPFLKIQIHESYIYNFCVSPNSNQIYSAGQDKKLRVAYLPATMNKRIRSDSRINIQNIQYDIQEQILRINRNDGVTFENEVKYGKKFTSNKVKLIETQEKQQLKQKVKGGQLFVLGSRVVLEKELEGLYVPSGKEEQFLEFSETNFEGCKMGEGVSAGQEVFRQ